MEWQAGEEALRQRLGVLPGLQLFNYARHFPVLPGRGEQERALGPKGENRIEGTLQ